MDAKTDDLSRIFRDESTNGLGLGLLCSRWRPTEILASEENESS